MKHRDAIIFDIGEVLLNTGVRHLYQKIFLNETEMEHFLTTVLTGTARSGWGLSADVGGEVEKLALLHPKYSEEIRAYFLRFEETVNGTVLGMADLIKDIDQSVPLYALSNWGGDTFEKVRHLLPMRERFADVLISGTVGLKKPDPRFFALALSRFNVTPSRTIFIDDKIANVEEARRQGFTGIECTDANTLRDSLQKYNILNT